MGRIVIAGRSYPVIRVALRGGLLRIIAESTGPSPATEDEPVTVFGQDGQGVCQGWLISLPETTPGERMEIVLPLQIDRIDTLPGETTVIRD